MLKNKGELKSVLSITSQRQIYLGAWTEGLFDASNKTLHPEALEQFETLINKKLSVAHYYIGWEILKNPDLLIQVDSLAAKGWQTALNINPYYFNGCYSKKPLYKAIYMGDCDNFLHAAGKNLAHLNHSLYLLFAWEMNNDNMTWSLPYTRASADDYKKAWRHMHDIFVQEGVSQVLWVYCPNVPEKLPLTYASMYPGDNYVDWIGLDGYNWGTTQSWSNWLTFSQIFSGAYKSITTVAPNKPLMLAETNTTNIGGSKPDWYKDTFLTQIPNNFPKIDMVLIFNEDKSKDEGVNWKVDVNSESLEAFRQVVSSGFYK